MEHTTLKIEGMTCHHCVHAVQNRLAKMPGVKVGEVKIGSAVIERDPAVATIDAIAEAIADEGYTLST
ncbi:MAG: heavy-metal-associated domain-containing protein [Gemmatimonadota bacterium]|nr:heavy-metal-associated domain-containing protein [Gemmatimonadota bacterium]MDE3127016.1 heavy-metal-associated domain-containing protein [Gemmatimonadota bacterium]MDE3216531.1 heavy-metal-associated domain-containing protein [Gemmatimonadota bacterium]